MRVVPDRFTEAVLNLIALNHLPHFQTLCCSLNRSLLEGTLHRQTHPNAPNDPPAHIIWVSPRTACGSLPLWIALPPSRPLSLACAPTRRQSRSRRALALPEHAPPQGRCRRPAVNQVDQGRARAVRCHRRGRRRSIHQRAAGTRTGGGAARWHAQRAHRPRAEGRRQRRCTSHRVVDVRRAAAARGRRPDTSGFDTCTWPCRRSTFNSAACGWRSGQWKNAAYVS